jgi:peroxiredoxin
MRVMAVAVVSLVLLASLASEAGAAPAAPGFRVKLLDTRQTFDSREHFGKHVVVVRFQASWCRVCVKESPAFARLADRYRARGVEMIALHVQDPAGDARRFVKLHHPTYRVALDPRLAIANHFESKGTPDTFVIDRRGEIVAHLSGASAITRLPRVLDEALRASRR